ncbi:hypothetical protein AKO1_015594 [Acrasis kona]|uniref:Oligopeptide transporter, OPT family n=1 Tax=Acrasis kona TaxID=1008807 RepID=A0AAW2ZIF4_9EUKA
MVLGSFVATVGLLPSLLKGLKAGLDGFKSVYYKVLSLFGKAPSDYSGDVYVIRTERDIPFWVISGMCLVLIVPLIILFYVLMHSLGLSLFMTSFVIILGFMFSACSGLLAGMIGSSNNPISGITLATVLTGAICLQLILPNDVGVVGPAAALFMGCIIACAAALSSDNMQDLKCGYVVGSTPWKQQLAQLLGCIVPSLVLAPIIMLLNNAYGIGIPPSEKYPTPLAAPQARLLADVARGVFTHKLPWGMVGMGIVTACVIVALDWLIIYKIFRSNKYRVSVLAVATGLYLPFELSVPILIGGILSVVSKYYVRWRVSNLSKHSHAPELELDIMGDESVSTHNPDGVDIAPVDNIEEQMKSIVKKERCSLYRMGLLFAAGTITGESIVGIVMAIPIVIAQNTKVFAIFGNVNLEWLAPLFCFVIIVVFFGIRVGMFIPKRWWAE